METRKLIFYPIFCHLFIKCHSLTKFDLFIHPFRGRTNEYLEEVAIMIANDIASGKIKPDRRAGLVDMLFSNALKIAYIRDFILGKAKDAVMKQTKGNYPAPLKVGF